jgi:hypothetical protein
MRPLIALVVLGSLATSASAAGTDIHEFVDVPNQINPVVTQEQHPYSRPTISGTFSRYRYFGRGSAGFGNW